MQKLRVTVTDLENNIELVRDYPYYGHSEDYTLGEQITAILEDLDTNLDSYSVPKFEIVNN